MTKEIEIPEGYEARIVGNKVVFELKDTVLQKAFTNSKIDYTLEEKRDASDYAETILPTSVPYGENEEEYKLHKIIEAAFIAGQKKEHQPAEWSEEDEKVFNGVIDTIKDAIAECDCDDVGTKARIIYEKELKWLETRLKSLRPQPHWKPSEEQMKALCSKLPVVKGGGDKVQDILEILYDDLKKL